MDHQEEFLFADGPSPELALPVSDDPLIRDIARVWELPIGRIVRLQLKPGESMAHLDGRLELISAPDLPFDSRQPLSLRIRGYVFPSRAIIGWSAME